MGGCFRSGSQGPTIKKTLTHKDLHAHAVTFLFGQQEVYDCQSFGTIDKKKRRGRISGLPKSELTFGFFFGSQCTYCRCKNPSKLFICKDCQYRFCQQCAFKILPQCNGHQLQAHLSPTINQQQQPCQICSKKDNLFLGQLKGDLKTLCKDCLPLSDRMPFKATAHINQQIIGQREYKLYLTLAKKSRQCDDNLCRLIMAMWECHYHGISGISFDQACVMANKVFFKGSQKGLPEDDVKRFLLYLERHNEKDDTLMQTIIRSGKGQAKLPTSHQLLLAMLQQYQTDD